jgi:hypothetical protein
MSRAIYGFPYLIDLFVLNWLLEASDSQNGKRLLLVCRRLTGVSAALENGTINAYGEGKRWPSPNPVQS